MQLQLLTPLIMANQDKEFLLSVKNRPPRWELFMYPDAAKLPAV